MLCGESNRVVSGLVVCDGGLLMLGSVVAIEGWCVTPCHVHDKITQLSCCAALHRARLEPG